MASDKDGEDADTRNRDKLIAAKQEWARDGRLVTGKTGDPDRDRVPPGQRLVKDWPVLDLGVTPKIDLEKWRIRIDGAVEQRAIWTWQDLLDQPQIESESDIHCVTGWSRLDNHWAGISAKHVIETVRPIPEATHCVFYSRDGYTTNVRLDRFDDESVLLAHSWEGEPLSAAHGGPLRIIMPRWYFWKSAKWVRRIRFLTEDEPGYWEERGYHNEGDPWKEERYGDD